MALILSIDTALENAGVCIAEDDRVLVSRTNSRQADHASWIHLAIQELLQEAKILVKDLNAIAVTAGPGSYTGLRVGMATAKGLCYAGNIPLITESTLHLIALGAKRRYAGDTWICPMIDARRMEVFTTVFSEQLHEMQAPAALVLDEHSFREILDRRQLLFAGNGSGKWQSICTHPHAVFTPDSYTLDDLASVAFSRFSNRDFSDTAYAEPNYLKNVYTGSAPSN